jgi:outer membrane protein OmpA-like peptidoglycan-associated protein
VDGCRIICGTRRAGSLLYDDASGAKGRWATQGILFATGKANLKPESRPVLKEDASTSRTTPRRFASEHDGLWRTKPAASNATATGRAQNRRVEIVKQ